VSVFLDFLKRLVRSSNRKVYLIVDRHPVHRAKKVRDWLEENKEKIRMFFLPPYSPELKPDEYPNNDVKSNAVGRRRPATKDEMRRNISSYLRSTQKQSDIVKSYFKARPVRYVV